MSEVDLVPMQISRLSTNQHPPTNLCLFPRNTRGRFDESTPVAAEFRANPEEALIVSNDYNQKVDNKKSDESKLSCRKVHVHVGWGDFSFFEDIFSVLGETSK